MSLLEKFAYIISAILGLLVLGVVGGYWWSNTTPTRPSTVPNGAVFLRAPATGAPGPPRGQWLACWESNGHILCRLSSKDGSTEFEGEFIPYRGEVTVLADQLKINSSKTTKEKSIWSGNTWVPLIFLDNGEVLIPVVKYEEGKRIIDQDRMKLR
jgi:hypothetical protein